MSDSLNIAGLILDILGVIGLALYSEWGAMRRCTGGETARAVQWWGALAITSWGAVILGFVLQLTALLVKVK